MRSRHTGEDRLRILGEHRGGLLNQGSRIFVAGHRGLVGSALLRRLAADGYRDVITRTHAELELRDHAATEEFFAAERPEYVFLCAARVGGIHANATYPADFITTNLQIATSVITAAHRHRVKRLIFFGSTCAYPRECQQPMPEELLMTGALEPTSEAYAVSKIAGMKLCQAFNAQHGTEFVTVIPATLYGPGDHFDTDSSHVLSALLRRFHDAALGPRDPSQPVVVWGSGTPRREFLYVDDLADACVWLASLPTAALDAVAAAPARVINVGLGSEVTIAELASAIADVIGYRGEIAFDRSRPDGAPQKLLDSTRLARHGPVARTSLREGLERTYRWFRQEHGDGAPRASIEETARVA